MLYKNAPKDAGSRKNCVQPKQELKILKPEYSNVPDYYSFSSLGKDSNWVSYFIFYVDIMYLNIWIFTLMENVHIKFFEMERNVRDYQQYEKSRYLRIFLFLSFINISIEWNYIYIHIYHIFRYIISGPNLIMLRAYSWISFQRSLLAGLQVPYWVHGIGSRWVAYNTNTLSAALPPLVPRIIHFC